MMFRNLTLCMFARVRAARYPVACCRNSGVPGGQGCTWARPTVAPVFERSNMSSMIRCLCTRFRAGIAAALTIALVGAPALAMAQAAKPAPAKPAAAKPAAAKPAAKAAAAKPAAAAPTPPVQVASFGDWGVYTSETAKGKVCYAASKPKERAPKTLKRGDGYVFISNRPAEGVHNEVSISLGFPTKDGGDGSATIGSTSFALITKGEAAWVRNAAEDASFVESLRKGQSLVLKASSQRGNESTDRYSLSGIAQALDRVKKECP
jgi:hypothetical protein